MKTVPPGELLGYRDGREGDVAPVRVERLPSGAVRVVVRYPKPALDRARARLLISAAAVATFAVMGWQLTTRAAWFGILLSFTQLGMTFAAVMLILWWRAGWVYVFEASPARLVLETRGRVFNHEREALREHVKDVRVHLNRRGRADAMEIKSSDRLVAGMWLVGIGDRPIRDATAAIREGLGMGPA